MTLDTSKADAVGCLRCVVRLSTGILVHARDTGMLNVVYVEQATKQTLNAALSTPVLILSLICPYIYIYISYGNCVKQ